MVPNQPGTETTALVLFPNKHKGDADEEASGSPGGTETAVQPWPKGRPTGLTDPYPTALLFMFLSPYLSAPQCLVKGKYTFMSPSLTVLNGTTQ